MGSAPPHAARVRTAAGLPRRLDADPQAIGAPHLSRQGDVTRAIRAAKAAGLRVTRCEIDSAGKIVIVSGEEADVARMTPAISAERAFADWEAKYGTTK